MNNESGLVENTFSNAHLSPALSPSNQPVSSHSSNSDWYAVARDEGRNGGHEVKMLTIKRHPTPSPAPPPFPQSNQPVQIRRVHTSDRNAVTPNEERNGEHEAEDTHNKTHPSGASTVQPQSLVDIRPCRTNNQDKFV